MKTRIGKFYFLKQQAEKAGRFLRNALLFNPVEKYFTYARVLCISLEGNGAYLVYGRKAFSHLKIKHCKKIVSEDRGALTPDELAAEVATFAGEQKTNRMKYVLCIPKCWSIIRAVEFPVTVKENLADVVSYELDRITPLTTDNAYYDYNIISETSEKITILLAAAKAEQVNPYLRAFSARNINIGKLTVSPLAIHDLIGKSYKNGNALYVYLNEDAYECGLIIDHSVVRAVTGVVEAVNDSTIDDILRNTEPYVKALSDGGKQAGAIIICANETNYQLIRGRLPGLKVSHLDKDIKLFTTQKKQDLSWVAAGAFLGRMAEEADEINLLKKRNGVKKPNPFWATMIFLILIVLVGTFYFLAPVFIEQNKVEKIDGHIDALKPEMKKVEALKKNVESIAADIDTIYNFKKENVLMVELLKELTNILPKKTWLTRLRISDKTVEIEGYAVAATEIVPALENSRYFHKVEFASPTFRDPRQGNDRFVIKMELKKSDQVKKIKEAGTNNEKRK